MITPVASTTTLPSARMKMFLSVILAQPKNLKTLLHQAHLGCQCNFHVSLVSSVAKPPTPSKPLSEKQKEAILKVFATEIKTGQKVNLEIVQKKCCTTSILSSLSFSKSRVKQVVNHINYIISKEPVTVPHDVPQPSTSKVDSWLDEFDDPSTRSSGRQKSWAEADTQLMKTRLKTYDALPSTVVLRTLFNNDTALCEILHQEGWQRTYDKIKNIFKKKSRKDKSQT